MSHLNVLFVGDANLGLSGLRVARRHVPGVAHVCWTKGDQEGKLEARRVIRSRMWDAVVSFYNDLIFTTKDLASMRVPLNIHPALPTVPGVGYDTVPLVFDHLSHGATLHLMTQKIDEGAIYRVLERPLTLTATYTELRAANQALVLEMLDETMALIVRSASVAQLMGQLSSQAEALEAGGLRWGEPYWCYDRLGTLLKRLRRVDPSHRVFHGNETDVARAEEIGFAAGNSPIEHDTRQGTFS